MGFHLSSGTALRALGRLWSQWISFSDEETRGGTGREGPKDSRPCFDILSCTRIFLLMNIRASQGLL